MRFTIELDAIDVADLIKLITLGIQTLDSGSKSDKEKAEEFRNGLLVRIEQGLK